METYVTAIVLAAGSGSRMNLKITKQKLAVGNESVLRRTVRIFNECSDIDSIVVVAKEDELSFAKGETCDFEKVTEITVGGKTRLESAKLGFDAIPEKTDFVAIHDAARCFITADMISSVVRDAKEYGAATASCKITDTVKKVNPDGVIESTLPRGEIVLVQTPQVFKVDLYKRAVENVDLSDVSITDDNMLLENIGIYPYSTDTGKYNIKITTQEDLVFADFLLLGDLNV